MPFLACFDGLWLENVLTILFLEKCPISQYLYHLRISQSHFFLNESYKLNSTMNSWIKALHSITVCLPPQK